MHCSCLPYVLLGALLSRVGRVTCCNCRGVAVPFVRDADSHLLAANACCTLGTATLTAGQAQLERAHAESKIGWRERAHRRYIEDREAVNQREGIDSALERIRKAKAAMLDHAAA
eukprot:COSAG02_NODE_10517_length_1924_cov_1.519452_1_plen_115_part_00